MAASASIEDSIVIEQARYVNANLPASVIGGFFIACVVATIFWRVAPDGYILAWLGAGLIVGSYRLSMWRAFVALPQTLANARHCARHAIIGTALSGVLWGLSTLFMMPDGDVLFQILLVFAISMMGVASMFSFGVHYPTFLSFFAPSTGGAILALLLKRTTLDLEIAVGIAIFVAVALRFVAAFNSMFVRSLELRYENVGLVRELTVEKEAAEQANLGKSRFLAAASHDLRQPMHALNLYLGTLSGLELPDAARAAVGHVQQCADTMDELFRGLLDISKLDAGAIQPEITAFAVAPLIERIRLEFEPQALAKKVELRVVPSRLWVLSDAALLERILRNFTANALRYTESGKILIGCRRHGETLSVMVCDTGLGIAAEHQKAVFEEFYQVGNPNRDRSRGIGLGLAIVDRLARLLNAPITLTSKPHQGSIFSIALPIAPAPARLRHFAPRQPGPDDSLGGTLVLVVDDEALILEAMQGLLEQWGCTVLAARSGQEALEQLGSITRAPDALICDFRLAENEDGISVIEALRSEFNEDIPALILTGDTGPDRLSRIATSGFRVLHKPVDTKTLREALGGLLASAHAGE